MSEGWKGGVRMRGCGAEIKRRVLWLRTVLGKTLCVKGGEGGRTEDGVHAGEEEDADGVGGEDGRGLAVERVDELRRVGSEREMPESIIGDGNERLHCEMSRGEVELSSRVRLLYIVQKSNGIS